MDPRYFRYSEWLEAIPEEFAEMPFFPGAVGFPVS